MVKAFHLPNFFLFPKLFLISKDEESVWDYTLSLKESSFLL